MTLSIRASGPEDIAALEAIERACFQDNLWRADDFLRYDCRVAVIEGQVVGFIVVYSVFKATTELSESEILNIAVHPAYRRQGIAKALLQQVLASDAVYFLEVRESNAAARALYANLGFHKVGMRPGYYQSPRESAVVMQMKGC